MRCCARWKQPTAPTSATTAGRPGRGCLSRSSISFSCEAAEGSSTIRSVLTGPTGTGKTDWAAAPRRELPVEIVSVDSALVYRGLDIGTAKPPRELRERVPHHLIDICDPSESYSAGQFVADAVRRDRRNRSRGPHSAAGRRHDAVFSRAAARHRGAAAASAELRRDRRARRARGLARIARGARAAGSAAAARVHPNDPQRIQRALEVCLRHGPPHVGAAARHAQSTGAAAMRRWALVPADRATFTSVSSALPRMMSRDFSTRSRVACARRPDAAPPACGPWAIGSSGHISTGNRAR